MGKFDYCQRARDVNDAHAEVNAAVKEVGNRNDRGDRRTRRWLDAIEAFRAAYARVYPEALQKVDQGNMPASKVATDEILEFLEADPKFFRSGYMKQVLLNEIKKRRIEGRDKRQLQATIICVAQKPYRREFRHYCRLAVTIDDQSFRGQIRALTADRDPNTSRRATWLLAALRAANGPDEH